MTQDETNGHSLSMAPIGTNGNDHSMTTNESNGNGHNNGNAHSMAQSDSNGNGHSMTQSESTGNGHSTIPSNGNGNGHAPTEIQAAPSATFTGKVALITGSSRGIGKGIALDLASRGASIVINYAKSATMAQEVVVAIKKMGGKAIALQADVSQPEQIRKLFADAVEHFGRLDIVVSNSGTEVWRREEDVTVEDFDYIFNINCRGQFFVAQQGLKYLGHGGRIILMSSVAATMSGIPNHALYAGSKAAVEGFTRSFAVDCGEKGITVNAIAPGGVKTDMYDENAWHYVPGGYAGMPMETIDEGLANFCPLKRVGLPEDIGKAVSMLVSPDSEWINGQVIKLSGGSIT